LPVSGLPVYYSYCSQCGFVFSPEMCKWEMSEFELKVYNKDYATVDPDYTKERPTLNANNLNSIFDGVYKSINHLDYGGGDGLLSRILCAYGWNSTSWDPFTNKGERVFGVEKFDLITAYEVFEHAPDANALMNDLQRLLNEDGLILFSTLITDGNITCNTRITWWYASPRNGHISLFSAKSLSILATNFGFNFGSFSSGFHVFYKTVPRWAGHIIKINNQNI
jgi:SAM-dependent methyltransferase